MKKLLMLSFIILLAMGIIAINSCTKDANVEQQSATEGVSVSSDITTQESGENIAVTGGGTTEEFGEKTTYEFNAVQSKGKITGHFILKFRAAGGSLWVDIDCLRLFDDNKATISGVITKVTLSPHADPDVPPPPYIFVGGRVSFTCQDNGEGNAASPDLVSDIGVLDMNIPASCADEWPVYLPLDGNVQINK